MKGKNAKAGEDEALRARLSRWLDAMLAVKRLGRELAALSKDGVVDHASARTALENLDAIRNELIDGMIF